MSAQEDAGTGIRILSFDNGGPGCCAQLVIVKEYMGRLASDLGVTEDDLYPADYFDLIGGVGFGGLLALMLGHLRMTGNEAEEALLSLASDIFPEGPKETGDPNLNSKKLKVAVENMLQSRQFSLESRMYDRDRPQTTCKVVLYAASSANVTHSQAFRTYSSRGSSLNPTVVEAACATLASPPLFLPVKIGPRFKQQSFVGGGIGANNPTRELLNEARTVFGKNRRVAQIISLGSGARHVLSSESSNEASVNRLLQEMARDCDAVAKDLTTRLFNVDAYLRLNVDKGMEDIGMADWELLGDIETHTRVYIEGAAVTEALDVSLKHLRERIGTFSLGQLTHSSSVKAVAKMAPSVSPHYVVRKNGWEKMVHHLVTSTSSRQRIFPITGMGGCGKTQIVSYFLQEHPSLYTHSVFIDASSVSSIKADLQTWVRTLGDGHERDIWEDGLRILAGAPAEEQWALILDNADDPTLNLVPFLPKRSNVTVVITSRNRDLGNLSTTHHLELGEMEMEEALDALLKSARRQLPIAIEEIQSANTLMKELGCLAVALVQAGTYCHQMSSQLSGVIQPYTFTKYLSIFNSHRAELMKKAEPSSLDNYQRGAYTTLDLSYTALPQASRDFLHVISFFRHTDIPLAAFAAAADYGFNDRFQALPRPEQHQPVIAALKSLLCVNGQWGELHVHDIIRTLYSFSLLSTTSSADSVFLQLHPLIQAWSRDMNASASKHYPSMSLQVLAACIEKDALPLNRLLLPHALEILDQRPRLNLHINDMVAIGVIFSSQGYFHRATMLFETALEIVENAHEKDDDIWINVISFLGKAYADDGKWNKAEEVQAKLLETHRRLLGEDHPNTINAAANLASTWRDQGRWSEAEKMYKEVLEQQRRIIGLEHPDALLTTSNLAFVYNSEGRWAEAEKLEAQVLEKRRRILGVDHLHTINAAANLASTYRGQGQYARAEELQVRVLEQYTRILGVEHPDTIMTAASLAATYYLQGRYEDSVTLLAPAVQASLKVLGQQHHYAQRYIGNLAAGYEKLGKYTEAEEMRALLLT